MPHPIAPNDVRTRVGIVDDHPAIIAALSAAIAETSDLELVGSATTLDQGIDLASSVGVLVCDLQIDGHAEGLQLLERVHRQPAPPAVLVLSGFDQPSVVRAAIDRGAAGYLDKGAPLVRIIDAIRTIASGGTVFTTAQIGTLHSAPRRPSDREIDVIGLVVHGATNAEVAARLGLSEKTIESHLRRLFDRYGLLSRTELAVLSIQEGWSAPSVQS